MKGISGWIASPLVQEKGLEDSIPEEPEEEEDGIEEWSSSCEAQGILKNSQTTGRITPAADQVAVEHEAADWAGWWKANEPYDDPWVDGDLAQQAKADLAKLPRLQVHDIRTAARSFPTGTGVGVDNTAPRALDRLTDAALEALIDILHRCEKEGEWGKCNALVLTVLLPKPDGGVRPIGLLPTPIRIWMRARADVARRWEAQNASPCLFRGKGMGAQKAAWQAAFRAEFADAVNDDKVQALLDMTKAFETIPHKVLAQTARRHGYNLALLKLSLAAYRMARTVGMDGVQSAPISATRGITAGSGFATTELRILMQDVVFRTLAEWGPTIGLTLYVDDLTVETSGTPAIAAAKCAAAVDFIVDILQKEMGFTVSLKKSVVVASTPVAAVATALLCKEQCLTAVKRAKLLGTDTTAGAKRSTYALKTRKTQFKKRNAKLQMLRKLGVNTAAMAQASAAATMTYGGENIGIADTMLHDMRSITAKVSVGPTAGKSVGRSLYAVDGAHGTIDPAFAAHLGPIVAWANAWWEKWEVPSDLQRTFKDAKARIAKAKGTAWSVVKGPVAAAQVTASRLGWKWLSPSTALDDAGKEWDFRLDPPAAIKKAVKQSTRRWRLQQIAKEVPGLMPVRSDIGDGKHANTRTVDCSAAALSALVRGKGAPKDYKDWSCSFRPSLTSAVAGGQWPQAKKARVKAWRITDPNCQLCGESVGTLAHRFECRITRPNEGWPAHPESADHALTRMGAGRRAILQTHGLSCVKVPVDVRPKEGTFEWLSAQPDVTRSDLVWYTDGSCSDPTSPETARYGFAVVVVSTSGELLGYGAGTPPDFVTDSGMAEIWAVYSVVAMSPGVPRIVTDYKGIIDTSSRGTAAATTAACPNARIWKMIASCLDSDISTLCEQVIWMPAHLGTAAIGCRTKSNGKEMTSLDWRANRLVDKLALFSSVQTLDAKRGELLVHSAKAAAKHALARLGQVTHEANNHKVQEQDEQGKMVTHTLRDSTSRPLTAGGKKAAKPEPQSKVAKTEATDSFSPSELTTLIEKARKISKHKGRKAKRGSAAEESSSDEAAVEKPKATLSAEEIKRRATQLLETAKSGDDSHSTAELTTESAKKEAHGLENNSEHPVALEAAGQPGGFWSSFCDLQRRSAEVEELTTASWGTGPPTPRATETGPATPAAPCDEATSYAAWLRPQSSAVKELLAADAAGVTTPQWSTLVALYELAKPFLVEVGAASCAQPELPQGVALTTGKAGDTPLLERAEKPTSCKRDTKKAFVSCASYVPCVSNVSCASNGPVAYSGPLSRVIVADGPVRARPTRVKGEASSAQANDQALYSLLGRGQGR